MEARHDLPASAEPSERLVADPRSLTVKVLLVVVTAVVLPTVMVTLVAVKSPELSRLDEPVHLDYLRRVGQGEIPRVGDFVLPESIRDAQCRSVGGHRSAPCDLSLESYTPGMLGASGYQYEAQQPPLYYAVTALARQVVRLGPSDDFVLTARLTGVGWLVVGLLLFWSAARRLGLGWWPTAAVAALISLSPNILYQAATVNNDAAAVLTGAAALLLFADLRARPTVARASAWSAVAVALVLIKPTGVVAVAAVCGALLLDALIAGRLRPRLAGVALLPLAAGLLTYLAWGQVRDARATVDYDVVLDALLSFKMVDGLPVGDVVATVTRLLHAYATPTPVTPSFVTNPATLVVYALVAASLASLWLPRWGSAPQRLGLTALVLLVLGGPAFTLLFYLDYSVEGGPHSRYGLSLIPLVGAAAAATYRTRRGLALLGGLVALVMVPSLVAILDPGARA
jgi:hypothetical protein